MADILLILRPEPGAAATAARARRLGLEAVVAPLFTIEPVGWRGPDAREVDALLLTSANAARSAGPGLREYAHLPCFAVGEATAAAAGAAGLKDVRAGRGDGAAAAAMAAEAGAKRLLHLCGREHVPIEHPALAIVRRTVYAAEPLGRLPEAARAGGLALIHSPRAARRFGELVDRSGLDRTTLGIAAISEAAAAAAGSGWGQLAFAARPTDEALLELAAKLCKTAPA